VQQAVADQQDFVQQLLQLAAAWPAAWGAVVKNGSSSSRVSGSSAGPKLPQRVKGRGGVAGPSAGHQAAAAGEAGGKELGSAVDACVLSARAATLLSRVAKQAAGVQLLQQAGALDALAAPVAEALPALQRTEGLAPTSKQQKEGAQLLRASEAATEWLSAAVRTLALIAASVGWSHNCSAGTAGAVISVCCSLLRASALDEAVKGNASLVLKSFAGEDNPAWRAELAQVDAVEALVTAARLGRGNPCSKNAGIALAVLSRAGGVFIERLRELRGLEVLYEYVKP
jgi:hypothetical protein